MKYVFNSCYLFSFLKNFDHFNVVIIDHKHVKIYAFLNIDCTRLIIIVISDKAYYYTVLI